MDSLRKHPITASEITPWFNLKTLLEFGSEIVLYILSENDFQRKYDVYRLGGEGSGKCATPVVGMLRSVLHEGGEVLNSRKMIDVIFGSELREILSVFFLQ